MLDDLMNYQYSLPHINPYDLHVFDRDEMLDDMNGNTIMVGDRAMSNCGIEFTIDVFLDVVAVGTYAVSEEDGVFFFTSEVSKIEKEG